MNRTTITSVIIKAAAFVAVIILILSIFHLLYPTVDIKPLAGVAASVSAVIGLFLRYGDKILRLEGRNLNPSEKLHHREAMRQDFEPKMYERRQQGTCYEIIVRHVNRADNYPDINETGKQISSWFKAELIDTYHKGIRVLLGIHALTICPDGYRFTDHGTGDEGDVKGFLFGEIPYDSIEVINWDGDEFYNFPIVYCHFDHSGMPYESLVFDKEIGELNGKFIYETIADHKAVKMNSSGYTGAL